MPYISGFDRNQSFLFSLDNFIDENNPVRLIDSFVDLLDLDSLGFITFSPSAPGQKPYNRYDLLKLHIYGYINGIRSSRKLAKEATRNIELMWLLNNASPAKSCISNFIKENKIAIKNTFKKFVDFLQFADFVDANASVIDGTKIRAQNSRNKYYSIKKIDATIDFFNSQIDKYLNAIQSSTDSIDSDPNAIISISQKIDNYKTKLEQYYSIKNNMIQNNLSQITLTDPDSRMMSSHGNSDISYNLQTSVDSKNSLIVAFDVVNDVNDTNQLENMVNKTIDHLSKVPISFIADMGYFNAEQIVNCEQLNTKIFVKRPKTKNSTNNSAFSIDKFYFDPIKNTYTCPAGNTLTFSRNLRKRKNKSDKNSSIIGFEYSCANCSSCPHSSKCTSSSSGRRITRNFYQDTLDKVQKRFDEYPEIYTLRKCVVEHPFGTIKRSMGYTFFLRKGLSSVNTEAALICLAYDFKRLTNISNIKDIMQKMREFFSHFLYIFYLFSFDYKKIIIFL
jgi:transposase